MINRNLKAQDLGFDPKILRDAKVIIQKGLDDGLYPGAVYLIGRSSGFLEPECFGFCDLEKTRPVTPDTIYDIASVTKPVATATSILLLMEQRSISLDQPISDFFSNFNNDSLANVTLLQLITHTSGLPAYKDLYSNGQNRDKIIENILSTPLDSPPGTVYTYSCLGYMLLGEIVRIVSGNNLDIFAKKRIFLPLEMYDTNFKPENIFHPRIAVTANCPIRQHVLLGEVHDPNAWAMGGVSGNSGLFSTVIDLAKFVNMMLSGGAGLLSPASIRLMFQNLINPSIGGHTAGWFIFPNEMLPISDFLSFQAISHTGFTGASVTIDASCDTYVILLTNRVCYSDNGADFRKIRRIFHSVIFQPMLSS